MNTETLNNNILIAKFLGAKQASVPGEHIILNDDMINVINLKYHKDWNWLMRTIITYYDRALESTNPEIRGAASHLVSTISSLKISFIYQNLVEAVKTYNKQIQL